MNHDKNQPNTSPAGDKKEKVTEKKEKIFCFARVRETSDTFFFYYFGLPFGLSFDFLLLFPFVLSCLFFY